MIFSIEKRRFRWGGEVEEPRSYYLRYRIWFGWSVHQRGFLQAMTTGVGLACLASKLTCSASDKLLVSAILTA